MPPENSEEDGHYFALARAKVIGVVEFCERMAMEFDKEDMFRPFKGSHRKVVIFTQ